MGRAGLTVSHPSRHSATRADGACRACRAPRPAPLIEFGPHPVCSHLLPSADAPDDNYPLAMARCGACGAVQLVTPPPAEALRAPAWMKYTEPEKHLDALAATLAALPELAGRTAVALGVHDVPLVTRLAAAGLGARLPGAASDTAGRNVIVSRYTYEHAHDAVAHLDHLAALAGEDGLVLLEVPDCTEAFRTRDYTTLWEEHTLYLTPASLRRALAASGWTVAWLHSYPNPLHNALVALIRRDPGTAPGGDAGAETDLAEGFAEAFPRVRERTQRWVAARQDAGQRLALFGAGHVGLTFLTVMGIAGAFAFAVDDNPQKQGCFLPGVRLPIQPSAALIEQRIDLALLAVSPASEAAVLERLQPFLSAGGRVASIFPASAHALPVFKES